MYFLTIIKVKFNPTLAETEEAYLGPCQTSIIEHDEHEKKEEFCIC